MGKDSWKEVRSTLTNLLAKDTATLRDNAELKSKALVKQSDA